MNRVRTVKKLDLSAVSQTKLVVMSADLRVFCCHPFVRCDHIPSVIPNDLFGKYRYDLVQVEYMTCEVRDLISGGTEMRFY